eukprot:9472675-Pyramimonas_sp.AAC.1
MWRESRSSNMRPRRLPGPASATWLSSSSPRSSGASPLAAALDHFRRSARAQLVQLRLALRELLLGGGWGGSGLGGVRRLWGARRARPSARAGLRRGRRRAGPGLGAPSVAHLPLLRELRQTAAQLRGLLQQVLLVGLRLLVEPLGGLSMLLLRCRALLLRFAPLPLDLQQGRAELGHLLLDGPVLVVVELAQRVRTLEVQHRLLRLRSRLGLLLLRHALVVRLRGLLHRQLGVQRRHER